MRHHLPKFYMRLLSLTHQSSLIMAPLNRHQRAWGLDEPCRQETSEILISRSSWVKMETFEDPRCKPSGSTIGNDNHLAFEQFGEVCRLPSPAGDLQSAKVSSTTNGDRRQIPKHALEYPEFSTEWIYVSMRYTLIICRLRSCIR